jgi:SpoVK/Ycf46/Vps4 family AAA+-type ATPase
MNQQFLKHVAATYPLLWIDTAEYDRAINSLSESIDILDHNCVKWDMVNGITDMNGDIIENSNDDPIQPLEYLEDKEDTVMFIQDYHLYLESEYIWRKLLNDKNDLQKRGNVISIVSPVMEIPDEIDRYITVIDFELPNYDKLKNIVEDICDDMDIEHPENIDEIIKSGLGLTQFEFENSLYLSISSYGEIRPNVIHKQKEQLIRKNSTLEIEKSDRGFESLYGLNNLKYFSKKMANSENGRGILLVGVPGGGKSHFARTLGNETDRITISMDFGSMMGSLVGETERKTREALKIIDAMEPAILFVDEIEKGLAGVTGSNGDSGTSQRQGGQFLRWLSDHESDVYVVATSNDISKLPPEYLRAERWDAIFFVDLPNQEERQGILDLYRNEYNVNEDEECPNIQNWTGAEIKTLCKLSDSLEVPLSEAKNFVTPLYKTMEEKIKSLQDWAKDRTIPASKIEVDTDNSNESKRKVSKITSLG